MISKYYQFCIKSNFIHSLCFLILFIYSKYNLHIVGQYNLIFLNEEAALPHVKNEEAEKYVLIANVYGSIHETAYYFTDVLIGSPKLQRQSIILDTGSSIMGIKCKDCYHCGVHIDEVFDPSISHTIERIPCLNACLYCDVKKLQCAYKVSYLEGSSLTGLWYKDVVSFVKPVSENLSSKFLEPLKNSDNFNNTYLNNFIKNIMSTAQNYKLMVTEINFKASFGCHTEEMHLFATQDASGILGLELWSNHGTKTFIAEAFMSGKIKKQVFSLCLSEHGGLFVIGDMNKKYHDKENVKNVTKSDSINPEKLLSYMAWSNFSYKERSYKVRLTSIKVGNFDIHLNIENNRVSDVTEITLDQSAQGFINMLVDSGTTLTYFPLLIFKQIFKAIQDTLQQNKKLQRNNSNFSRSVFEMEQEEQKILNTKKYFGRVRKLGIRKESRFENFNSETNFSIENMTEIKNLKNPNIERTNSPKNTYYSLYNESLLVNSLSFSSKIEQNNITNEDEFILYNKLPSSAKVRRAQGYRNLEECFYLPSGDSDLIIFPIITLGFEPPKMLDKNSESSIRDNNVVKWYPRSYMYQKGSEKYRCLAIASGQFTKNTAILGSSFFIGHDVVFDIKNQVVGFVTAKCPYSYLKNRFSK